MPYNLVIFIVHTIGNSDRTERKERKKVRIPKQANSRDAARLITTTMNPATSCWLGLGAGDGAPSSAKVSSLRKDEMTRVNNAH